MTKKFFGFDSYVLLVHKHPKMRTYLTISILFFLVSLSQKTRGQTNTPKLGGDKTYSWGSFDHYYAKDSLLCVSLAKVSLQLQRARLSLHIIWNDHVIDSRKITQQERRWKDPQGKIRDKDLMYFYDGLGIRLYYKDYFYEGWIMPLEKDSWQIQWENAGSMADKTSNTTKLIELKNDKNQLILSIPFTELGWSISEDEKLKVTLIAVDSDTPEIEEVPTRIKNGIRYCISTKELRIN